jgi:WD40 repeat protein
VEQQRLVYADSQQALASGLPRCLPPLTPSLDQAGGLQRLALRGHTGPVTKVLLTPSGTDAVTASADGTARVWDLDIGDCVLLLEGHAGPITDMAVTSGGWVSRNLGKGCLGGGVSSRLAVLLPACLPACTPQHTSSTA